MALWSWTKTPQRKNHRQQIEEYGLANKPFTKGLLLSTLAQIEATESDGECGWKDLDSAILNSVVTVTSHITSTAMKDNGLMLLLGRGLVVRQPKMHAILAFNTYVQICLFSHLIQEGATIDRLSVTALTLRALCVAIPEDEWNRVLQELTQLLVTTTKELAKEDHPFLTKWKSTMDTFVPAYILSFVDKSPQFQVANYPWIFEQHLAQLLKAVEG